MKRMVSLQGKELVLGFSAMVAANGGGVEHDAAGVSGNSGEEGPPMAETAAVSESGLSDARRRCGDAQRRGSGGAVLR